MSHEIPTFVNENMKQTIITILLVLVAADGQGQTRNADLSEYTRAKNLYCHETASRQREIGKTDDLTFLLDYLPELKIDRKFILSDFRRPFSFQPPKEWSSLRFYVRKKSQQRPEDEYFDKEYSRYQKCKRLNTSYVVSKNLVPFIDPFEKISLTGTEMSIWQAYLLHFSKLLYGMRNEANYDKTYIITSAEDVDSVTSLLKNEWEDEVFREGLDPNQADKKWEKHAKETFAAVDSLQNIKSRSLEPVFTYDADSVTIEHYAFAEFHGLVRFKTTMQFANRRHRRVRQIKRMPIKVLAAYRRNVWY